MTCPTCGAELQQGTLHEVPLGRCAGCGGSLVIRHDLVRLLGALSADLSPKLDLDAPVAAVPPLADPVRCPHCQAPMDRFGYLGAALVQPHACGACSLLWVAGAELVAMWRLFARTERQEAVLAGELADIQSDGVESFVFGWNDAPTDAQMLVAAASLFVPEVALLARVLTGGGGSLASQPLPDWLRLAEPPKAKGRPAK